MKSSDSRSIHGMESYSRNKVSLRGASAKEISRDALLEKASLERSIRSEARKAASAAQLIQRVWRGHRDVSIVSEKLRSEWDAYVGSSCQQGMTNQLLSDRVLRPFLYFFRAGKGTKSNGDLKRFANCIQVLLQSISSPDSSYNYCSWCLGTKEEQNIWVCQVHKLIKLCSMGLVECSSWASSELAILLRRIFLLLVALTDSSLWHCFKDDETKTQIKLVVDALLRWISEDNTGFYPAIRICIIQTCLTNQDSAGWSSQLQKEKLFIIGSAITVALRPLQMRPPEVGNTGCKERQVIAMDAIAEFFSFYIYTIPYISRHLPAAILPSLQHPSVLTRCLQTFGILNCNRAHMHTTAYFKSADELICKPWHQYMPPSGWTLINIVSLAKGPTKDGFTKFVKDLAVESYVKAVCSLLDQLLPWAEKSHKDQEGDTQNIREVLQCSVGLQDHHDSDDTSRLSNAREQIIKELEPLYQQWHLQQLLEHTSGTDHKLELDSLHSGYVLKLPDIAMLYSKLLNVFTFLHGTHVPCPILNLLAFAPGFLSKLWGWLDNTFGLAQACELKAPEMSRPIEKGGTSHKDDRLSGSLSTRLAVAVSKMKGKASMSEMIELDTEISERSYGEDLTIWNINKFKSGPSGLTNEALSIFTLFCAAYSHLLMVLDDEEFYERQILFTLKQQRIIAASLNTLVYNGLLSSSKKPFMPFMEAAIKCLNALYGRHCRRSFCHQGLWLSPAGIDRPPIPAAARAYEVALASHRTGELSQAPAIGHVLTMIPHVIPFEERVQIFREFVKSDKMARKMAGEVMGPGPGSIEIAIRRDHLIEDAFTQLNSLGSKLKSGLNVSFVNEHGLAEAGLDYGGLFKEFLTDLAKAAFDPGYGLFTQKETEEGRLFPHPAAGDLQHGLPMIEFLGRIVGKAMYEGILLDYSFSHVFIWKLLGRYIFLDELSTLDPELYQSLIYLKHYEGDVKDLALDFTATEELFGRRIVVELISGGANIPVTNENKLQYVYAMADYKLNKQMQRVVNAFSRGLSDIISLSWLTLFNAQELNQLLSGGEHDFDIDDLKANTKYTGGFTENSRTIKQFWEVLREFQAQERCAVLKFVTSCPRAPLLGFKHLQPVFTIHKVNCDTTLWAMLGGQDVDRLPSASTCYNTLKLPTYKRISTLRNKLRYAINSNAGFELS